jgi:fused signal recognition particle receptor
VTREALTIALIAIGLLAVLSALVLVGLRRRRGVPPSREGAVRAPGPVAAAGGGGDGEGEAVPSAGAPAAGPPAVETPADGADGAAGTITLERPESARGRLVRLRARLSRSNSALGQGLLSLLTRDRIDAATWEEVEDTLLLADVGAGPAEEIVQALQREVAVLGGRDPEAVRALLRRQLVTVVDPGMDRSLHVDRHIDDDGAIRPAVVLVVGVNGTGKTTTVGKLARVLVAEDKDVLLGAADTFRAAAVDQLQTWGERVGVPTVRSDREGADPASVAFDAVKAGIEVEADVVLIDTAGRLQNKVGLMDELGKVKRVVERHGPVDEVLLVLDATTGQNGMQQARVFADVVDITGIVLTKLDGTAKGGIVVAVQRELGVPVKLVGLGEGPDDLAPFEVEAFVDALLT